MPHNERVIEIRITGARSFASDTLVFGKDCDVLQHGMYDVISFASSIDGKLEFPAPELQITLQRFDQDLRARS